MKAPGWYLRLLSSLYLSTFVVRASFAISFIVFPLYLKGTGIQDSYLFFALVLSLSPLLELSTVLGLGAYIDKAGRKRMLVGGAVLSAVALALFSVSNDPLWVAFVNGLHGISAAAVLVSSLALITDYADHSNRGREMGVFEFIQVFGWFAGFAIGGVLSEVWADDLQYAFLLGAGLGAFGAVYAVLNVTEPERREHLTDQLGWSHLVSVLKQRSVVLLILPWMLVYVLISSVFTFASKAGFEEANLSGYQLALLLCGGGAFLLVTFVFFGRMSDKYGRMPIMLVGTAGMVGVMLTVGAYTVVAPEGGWPLTDPRMWPFLGVGGLFAFMAGAFGPSALASLADVSHKKKRGMTMGLYSFVISLAMTVGPIISGAVIDRWGGAGVLALMTAIAMLMLALVLVQWWDRRRSAWAEAGDAAQGEGGASGAGAVGGHGEGGGGGQDDGAVR